MAIKTVTGGGVTVSMSAPSFPPSMDVGNICEDFKVWMVNDDSIGSTNPAVVMRTKWISDGISMSADIVNPDWISVTGGSEIVGSATFG